MSKVISLPNLERFKQNCDSTYKLYLHNIRMNTSPNDDGQYDIYLSITSSKSTAFTTAELMDLFSSLTCVSGEINDLANDTTFHIISVEAYAPGLHFYYADVYDADVYLMTFAQGNYLEDTVMEI